MKKRSLLILLGSIGLILTLAALPFMSACAQPAPPPAPAPAPPPVKPIVLTFSTGETTNSFLVKRVFEPWFAEIEKGTGGRVKIEPYYAETLVSFPDSWDAVVKGTVDIAHGLQGLVPGKFPMDEIMALPTYYPVCWRPNRVFWELFQKFPEMRAPYADAKLLWIGCTFITCFGTSKKPVRKLEDNQGLKMVIPGKMAGMRGAALGWTPVGLPPGELYMAVERGVADGGPAPLYGLYDFRWGEVYHYVTLVPFTRPVFFCIMNLDKWNSLPPDIQKIIDEVSSEHMIDMEDREQVLIHREYKLSAPEDFGTVFIEPSPEELARWAEADKPVIEAFVAELEDQGLPGKELVDEYFRLSEKYSAEEYAFK